MNERTPNGAMKVNPIRPSHRRWPRSIARRRETRGLGLSVQGSTFSRHARWAQRIAARFVRNGTRPSIGSQEMVLAFGVRPWFFVLKKSCFNTRLMDERGRAVQPHVVRETQTFVRNFTSARIYRESAPEGPYGRGAGNSAASPDARAHRTGRRTRGTNVEETPSAARPEARAIARSTPSLLRTSTLRSALILSAAEPTDREEDQGPRVVIASVTQKHRRIEERGANLARDIAPVLALSPSAEPTAAPNPQAATARKSQRSIVEPEPNSPAARGEAPLNISRVTEEILEQLDRRMTAARERMGRI